MEMQQEYLRAARGTTEPLIFPGKETKFHLKGIIKIVSDLI